MGWIDDLDAHGSDDDETVGDEVVFPDGYDQLVTHPRTVPTYGFRACRHGGRLGSVGATAVGRQGVSCADGGGDGSRRSVAGPGRSLSRPRCPEPVSCALNRLTMNNFEKIFLRFPRKFPGPTTQKKCRP